MKIIYTVLKKETWSDHRRTDGFVEVVAITEDAFTAYVQAIELWVEKGIEETDYYEDMDKSNKYAT